MINVLGNIVAQAGIAAYCTFLYKIYLNAFLRKRYCIIGTAVWLFFFSWQLGINMKVIYFKPIANLSMLLVTMLAVSIAAYAGGYWKRCVFPLIFAAIWMLLEGCVQLLHICIFHEEGSFFTVSIISKVLLFLFVAVVHKIVHGSGGGQASYTGRLYVIIMLLLNMILYNAFYMFVIQNSENVIQDWMLLATCLLLGLLVSFYPIYLKLVELLTLKMNHDLHIKQMELYKWEMEKEAAAALEVLEMRHDIKQQYLYLRELIHAGEIESLKNTIEKMLGESIRKGRLESRTGNLAVDALVNNLWEKSKQEGIALHTDLKIPRNLNIRDEDLGIVLGNAIDNALEASYYLQKEKREIWLHIAYEKGCLYIALKNRYDGKIKTGEHNRLMSRKKELFHGFGLGSIERVAQKYHGYAKTVWEKEIFSLEITLYEEYT